MMTMMMMTSCAVVSFPAARQQRRPSSSRPPAIGSTPRRHHDGGPDVSCVDVAGPGTLCDRISPPRRLGKICRPSGGLHRCRAVSRGGVPPCERVRIRLPAVAGGPAAGRQAKQQRGVGSFLLGDGGRLGSIQARASAGSPPLLFDSEGAGVALFGLSAFFMAAMHIGVKLSVQAGVAVPMVILTRTLFGIAAALTVLTVARQNPLGKQRRMLLTRGLVGTGGVIGSLYASSSLPLTIVSLLSFTAPVATAAAATVFLKEPFPVVLKAVAVISLLGVCLLLEPWSVATSALDSVAVFAATVAPCCIGGAAVLVRKLSTSGQPEHPQTVMLYLSGVTAVLAAILCLLTPGALQTGRAMSICWPALLLVAVGGWLSQLCMTMALARAPAAVASSMGYTQLVYTSLADFLLFGIALGGSQLAGAAVIMCSTLLLAWDKLRPVKMNTP